MCVHACVLVCTHMCHRKATPVCDPLLLSFSLVKGGIITDFHDLKPGPSLPSRPTCVCVYIYICMCLCARTITAFHDLQPGPSSAACLAVLV